MILGMFCNYGPPHCGGSETVLHNIAKNIVMTYGYKVNIYAFNYHDKKDMEYYTIVPCYKDFRIISQINENEHIFIYSDSFWGMEEILRNLNKINCRASLCLLGADFLPSRPDLMKVVINNRSRIDLICHSQGEVSSIFQKNGLIPNVIPNGVDLSEFKMCNVDFRKKYNIVEENVLLNVSNYFFGKGQELLPLIYKKLEGRISDFVIISISNSIKYPYDLVFLDRCKKQSKGMNIRFLRDLPREDVVSSFLASNIFLFTSKKEVSPLVILESRASKIPYVSMAVGNVSENKGGISIPFNRIDPKGYVVIDNNIIQKVADSIVSIMKNNELRNSIINDGQEDLELLDWKNIVHTYNKVFTNET